MPYEYKPPASTIQSLAPLIRQLTAQDSEGAGPCREFFLRIEGYPICFVTTAELRLQRRNNGASLVYMKGRADTDDAFLHSAYGILTLHVKSR